MLAGATLGWTSPAADPNRYNKRGRPIKSRRHERSGSRLSLIHIWGRNGSETVPLEGVKFEVKYANGQYVDAAGGTLSSNGLYYTDSTGKIILSGITGTVVVTELEGGGANHKKAVPVRTVVCNPTTRSWNR